MSTITIGQSETVREWVRSGEIARSTGGGVATEVAPGDESDGKVKPSRSRGKKKADGSDESHDAPAEVAEAPVDLYCRPRNRHRHIGYEPVSNRHGSDCEYRPAPSHIGHRAS